MKPLIIIAPDKFRGTLTSLQAAETIELVVREKFPYAEIVIVEMADGGEGTARLVAGDSGRPCKMAGRDCFGRQIEICFYESADRSSAFIDSAAVVGLSLLSVRERDAWNATTKYLGMTLRRLLSVYDYVTLCVGGTATADGGAGVLEALGARFLSKNGVEITRAVPACFMDIRQIDLDRIPPANIVSGHLSVLLDVDVPLLPDSVGHLSSLSFAGQKGIIRRDMVKYRRALEHYVSLLSDACLPVECQEYPFNGAGGGLAFPLISIFGCKAGLGGEALSGRVTGLIEHGRPTVVITGEGSVDTQSFGGKVVGTLIGKSLSYGALPIVIGGVVESGLVMPEGVSAFTTVEKPGPRLPTTKEAKRRLMVATCRAIPLIDSFLNK